MKRNKGTRKGREREKPRRYPGETSREGTVRLLIRFAVAAGLGLLLFLSQPYFSLPFRQLPALGPFLPVVLLPAIVGAFAGLSLPGLLPGGVLGFLIPFAGSLLAGSSLSALFPGAPGAGIALIQGGIGSGAAVAMVFLKKRIPVRRLAFLVLALLLLNFALLATHGWDRVHKGSAIEPPMKSYNFDGVFFLKVFYLVEHGHDFYGAWDTAFRGDIRYDSPFSEVWLWRMPTLYWIWSALASRGDTLVLYFLLLSMAGMVCAYLGASRHSDPVLGLWSAGFLGSYLYFGAVTFWYAITDYWGLFLALPAAALYLHGRRNVALPIALLAGLIREWSALLLVAGLLDNLVNRRWREAGTWAAGCALVGGAYLAHWNHVAGYLKQAGLPAIASRGGSGAGRGGGVLYVLYTAGYASKFLLGGPSMLYVVFAAGLLGSATAWFRGKDPFPALMVLAVFGGLMLYGTGMKPGDPPGTGDYAGIHFMPSLILCVPFAFRFAADRPPPA